MSYAPLAFLLIAQPVLVKPAGVVAKAPAPAPIVLSDEQILKNVHLNTTGAGLLDFFQQRTRPSISPEETARLTRQLSDPDRAIHDRAAAELVGLGMLVVPALRQAVNHAENEEMQARARTCLQAIEGNNGSSVVQSAVRVLALRNPEGAAAALLQFLPLADDDTVVQEIETALLTVGLREGKLDSALEHALTDPVPIRRSLAARVLCQIGGREGRSAVRPLLKDARPSVRMQAALSLTDSHDAEAMPVLIDLVAQLPPEGRKRVEEYLTEMAGEWAVQTPQGGDTVSGRLRRELWSAWWRTLDGKQLLEEFRQRTLSDEERTRALERIGKLEDPSPDVRNRASEELIGMGPRVSSLLRQVLDRPQWRTQSATQHVAAERLLQSCLAALERDTAKPMPEAAARLLALRRPAGTVEALLAYVPFAENEALASLLVDLLATVGCTEGKADPALVRALEDRIGTRRAAAAAALCKGKATEELDAVRKLLKDPDPGVRQHTALALVQFGDRTAVPALIDLLADLPLDQVGEIEDVLATLAGEEAPNERVNSDKTSRAASITAWKTWWKKHADTVDLARLNDAEHNSQALLAIDMNAGRILEINRNGRVRWQLQGPQWPLDAVVCRNGNIFIAQQNNNQVAMWNRQGKELWTRQCNMPFACQQLRNGNLFVVCRQMYIEFDANGKEVSSNQQVNLGWIVAGSKLPNGQIALFTQQGQYVRLDAAGKQVKTYQADLQGGAAMNAEVLPGDRALVALNIGRVAECDSKGKTLWEANVVNPAVPHRLPNGHTLVAQNGSNHFYELDRHGKIVAERKNLDYRPWRIRRR